MALCFRRSFAGIFFLAAAGISAQQPKPDADAPTIVRPGAPGQNSTILSPEEAALKPRAASAADISFMQGMIMHHSQAVEMTALLRVKGYSKDLQRLGERITISQTDEMEFMKGWLRDRGQAISMPMPMEHHMDVGDMKGMDHSKMAGMDMGSMPLMPGMLSPQQMDALKKANGKAFDHLFLTGMIQHHKGALTMVQELFDTAGAGQDAVLFDFATDVDNTQSAEIKIMQGMLQKEKR